MMTAECLPVPMVGHYHRTIGIKSFSEIYNLSCILNNYYKYTFTLKESSPSQILWMNWPEFWNNGNYVYFPVIVASRQELES